MDALCRVWLKLVQWFLRRRFLNFVNVFSQFRNYLPLEKGVALYFPNLNPIHPRMLCVELVEIGPVGLEDENVKVYRQTDGQTDEHAIRKAYLSCQLR